VPRISYAANHEDILLDRVFGDHVGTFLDVGVSGPSRSNLTYFFYQRGWRGVNLRPEPRRHGEFRAERSGDLTLRTAAWDSNGEIPLFEVAAPGGAALSTIAARRAQRYRAAGMAIIERRVPVRTIGSLVEELELDPPDFISIDAEGFEEPVIRGIPLLRWRPGVFVVAAIWPDTALPSHGPWEPVLLAQGYLPAAFNGVNRFYLRRDLEAKRAVLATPVSVVDQFERAETVALQHRVRHLEGETVRWRGECVRLDQAERSAARERHLAEIDRDHWKRTCIGLQKELKATQRALRPYRLIDQLGVVPIGYRWARRLKPNRAS
jgi:FkbM family methyltransferase